MAEAAGAFEGEHDFSAFAAADDRDAEGHSKVRTIFASELKVEGDRMLFRVRGSGFLKHMVRNLVGALLEIGKRNLNRTELSAMLDSGGQRPCVPTAPAKGLFLMAVEY
jgi:tRNA pseudouridine38-40 synthase